MAKTKSKLTTVTRIRFPNEVLVALDDWAANNDLPRSVAVRRLVLRSLTLWEDDPMAYCFCEGGTGACQQQFLEAAE